MTLRLRSLASRRDFRKNPLVAIGKRVWWRARWAMRKDPWLLKLDDGTRILAHRGGSAALIFFQKSSEPETTSFLNAFLKPGMVFVDGGAHIGEYSLRAARLVGPGGAVHAFEPSPENFEFLKRNLEQNGLANVRARCAALSESNGKLSFRKESDPTLNRLQTGSDDAQPPHGVITVDCCRLDSYWAREEKPINLIKLDVEGAELMVLRGTEHLERLPVWIFEYSPENYARFGYEPGQILGAFRDRGYSIWTWDGSDCKPVAEPSGEDMNLIAAPGSQHPLAPRH
jgi:FkbM family methyltransferase